MVKKGTKAIIALAATLLATTPALAAEDFPISADVETGIGFDTNAYRTPNGRYYDPRSGVGGMFINPDVQEGSFVPVRVDLGLDLPFSDRVAAKGKYTFDGSFYNDSKMNNADEQTHNASLGLEFAFIPEKKQRGTIYVGAVGKMRDKTYVDRDTGMPTITDVSETDISGKYTYESVGGEIIVEKRFDAFRVAINGGYSEYTYDDPVVVSSNDKSRTSGGVDFSYDVTGDTRLKAGYSYTVDEFDERRPHELDGTSGPMNERVEYVFHDIGVGVKQSFGKKVDAYLDYHHIIRNDEYKEYYDYTKNTVDGKIVVKPIENLKLVAKAGYTKTDYPDAFAFDLPAYPGLEYEIVDAGFKAEYMFTENFGAWIEYDYTQEDTTDLRYAYDRQMTMVGLRAEY
jgi:hypothetical protein